MENRDVHSVERQETLFGSVRRWWFQMVLQILVSCVVAYVVDVLLIVQCMLQASTYFPQGEQCGLPVYVS